MKRTWQSIASLVVCILALVLTTAACVAQTSSPTATLLSISPSGSVATGTTVTLTATVSSGGNSVNRGLVTFCNAAAMHCLDSAVLGTAQLTSAGVATLRLRLGAGSHSVKAIFAGTPHSAIPRAASTSATQTITATGLSQTSLYPRPFGVAGDFTINATIHGFGQPVPTGTVSFTDLTDGSTPLGSASITEFTYPYQGFALQPTPLLPGEGFSVAVGDFNDDGIPDIATVGYEQFGAGSSEAGTLTIMLGNGDGAYLAKAAVDAGNAPVWVTAADFNGDGNLDLAVADNSNVLRVLLGNGDGTFTALSPYTVGYQNYAMTTADYNGDGIPDLAVSDEGNNILSILLGTGDGTFTTKTSTLPGYAAYAMVTADFNRDSIPDLAVVTGSYPDNLLTILLSKGDGTFTVKETQHVTACSPSIVTGDFNGDGIVDLAASDSCTYLLYVLPGNGDGSFAASSYDPPPLASTALAAADFNGDGFTDLALADSDLDTVFLFNNLFGNGALYYLGNSTKDGTYPYAYSMQAADFNGDSIPDLVTANQADHFDNILLSSQAVTPSLSNVSLSGPGNHSIRVSYSGDANYLPSQATLIVSNATAPPQFSLAPGTYQWTQNVALVDPTPNSTMYYTLDGTSPTPSSARYTAPIQIPWETTIKAIAVSPGATNSTTTSGTYLIDRPVLPPSFSSPSGTYSKPFTFSLTPDPTYCSVGTCQLYYNLNGEGYRLYTSPITLTQPGATTVRAFATEWHYTTSAPATVTYQIK